MIDNHIIASLRQAHPLVYIEEPIGSPNQAFITTYIEDVDAVSVGCKIVRIIDVIVHVWTLDESYKTITQGVDDIFKQGVNIAEYCDGCVIIDAVDCRIWKARAGTICEKRWNLHEKTFRIRIS